MYVCIHIRIYIYICIFILLYTHTRNHHESSRLFTLRLFRKPVGMTHFPEMRRVQGWRLHPWGAQTLSINGGGPKWLVQKGKSHLEMDDLGVPPFQETSKYSAPFMFWVQHSVETNPREAAIQHWYRNNCEYIDFWSTDGCHPLLDVVMEAVSFLGSRLC